MAETLSHQSALDVIRTLRCEGISVHDMDTVSLTVPSAWVGKRLSLKNFAEETWRWQKPTVGHPLHILVPNQQSRMRSKVVVAHVAWRDMPAGSVLWLDEHSSIVCPELLFLQMAGSFSLSALVMLGMELCGHFSRRADEPLMGDVVDGIPAVTSVERLESYLAGFKGAPGLAQARKALEYVRDHAMSAPEAVLATVLGLPAAEGGYGLGPVSLNDRVELNDSESLSKVRNRYPDLMFGFAPVGLNYDGAKHFDITDLMVAAEVFARAEATARDKAREVLREKLMTTRAKVLDDNLRDRQLAAQGRIVFSVTKEDLSDGAHLDDLVRQVLSCAHEVFGVDVDEHLRTLEDTSLTRDRWELLGSLLPCGGVRGASYGKL